MNETVGTASVAIAVSSTSITFVVPPPTQAPPAALSIIFAVFTMFPVTVNTLDLSTFAPGVPPST